MKKAPGVDFKKIQAAKDRITFSSRPGFLKRLTSSRLALASG